MRYKKSHGYNVGTKNSKKEPTGASELGASGAGRWWFTYTAKPNKKVLHTDYALQASKHRLHNAHRMPCHHPISIYSRVR